MNGRIKEVHGLMGAIAAAQKQSRGIGAMNVTVSQMDQITQQNAATVKETSAETG